MGIVETPKALQMAYEVGLDLVEVAPTARPPVCRIMDYGKWKYAQKKKDQKAKSNRHESLLKEVRMRPKTDVHDQSIKVEHAKGFLAKGAKVQFTMLFRGREMVHLNMGHDIFSKIKKDLGDIAKVERDFKVEGRRLTMVVAPGPGAIALAKKLAAKAENASKPKHGKPTEAEERESEAMKAFEAMDDSAAMEVLEGAEAIEDAEAMDESDAPQVPGTPEAAESPVVADPSDSSQNS